MAEIIGTRNDDDLVGTNTEDLIVGRRGDDTINAGDGNDVINSGAGNDSVEGGAGNDEIRTGAGSDTVDGGDGSDVINSGRGDDTVDGGAGNDQISTGAGDDTVGGGDGNDTIRSGRGDDLVTGGEGDDEIRSGAGDDIVDGGAGSDIVRTGAGRDIAVYTVSENTENVDFYDGGRDFDTIRLVLTAEEYARANIAAEIASYEVILQGIANGTIPSGREFSFQAFDLTLRNFEQLEVVIIDEPNTPPTVVVSDPAPVTEGNVSDPTALVTVDLFAQTTITDPDPGDVQSVVADSITVAIGAGSMINDLSVLTIDQIEGTISFDRNAFNSLDDGELAVFEVTFEIQSGPDIIQQTISIVVDGENDAPFVRNVPLGDSAEDSSYVITPVDLLSRTTEFDTSDVGNLVVSNLQLNGANSDDGALSQNSDGTWTFIPTENFNSDGAGRLIRVSFDVSDGSVTVSAFATLNITAVNDAPVAVNDVIPEIPEGAIYNPENGSFYELYSDPLNWLQASDNAAALGGHLATITSQSEQDFLQNAGAVGWIGGSDAAVEGEWIWVEGPEAGTIFWSGDGTTGGPVNGEYSNWGTATSEPNNGTSSNYVGLTPLGTWNDGRGTIATGPSVVEFSGLPISAVPAEDTSVTIDVLANDFDVDGDTLTLTAASATNGQVIINADSTLTYTPNADFNGAETISYMVDDGNGGNDSATVSLTVNPTNDAPTATDEEISLNEDTTFSGQLPAYIDVEGDTTTYAAGSIAAASGVVSIQSDGAYTYTPNANFNGSDSFSYIIDDGNGGTNEYTVNVTVDPVNDAPLISEPVDLSPTPDDAGREDTAFTFAASELLANASDPDGDVLSVSNVELIDRSVGTIEASGDGSYSFIPATHFAADNIQVSFNLEDGNDGTITGTASLDLASVADAPTVTIATNSTYLTPAPLGADITVNTYTTSTQFYPSIAALNDGGFVVSWTSAGQDGSGNGIFGQRFDANGTPIGHEFQINSYTTNGQAYSAVAALVGGGFVATWTSAGQDGSGTGIFGQRFDANGSPAGDEFQVNTGTLFTQNSLSVTALGRGGYVITWTSAGQDGSGTGTYGQRFDENGNLAGSEFQINTYATNDQLYPSVSALGDDGFVVTWTSNEQDGSGYGIYGQLYDADGNTVGSEFQVNTVTVGDQNFSSVIDLERGGFVVTWSSNSQDGSGYGIYGQRFDANGVAVGNEFQVSTFSADDQLYSSTGALDDGGFVVTWSSDGQDGSGYGIYGQRFDASGTAVGSEFRVNDTTSGNQLALSDNGSETLAVLAGGRLVQTWAGNGAEEVFARLVELPRAGSEIDINVTASLVDTDGSEALSTITLSGLPIGFVVTDGINTTTSDGATSIDILGWSLASLSVTPEATFDGDIIITVSATSTEGSNGDLATATESVAFSIAAPRTNTGPVAVDDVATTVEDTAITIAVLANDFDVDGDTLSVAAASATNGQVVINSDDTLTYTPNANFNGAETISYAIDDGNGETDSATVSLTVNPANDDPTAADDAIALNEDTTFNGQLPAFTDTDGDEVTYAAGDTAADNGTVTIQPEGSYTYTPNADFNGADAFSYVVSDGNGGSNVYTVNVTVNAVNDAPVAVDDIDNALEDTSANFTAVLSNDFDVDGDRLSIVSVSAQFGMVFVRQDSNGVDIVGYRAAPNFNGIDVISYTVADGQGLTDSAELQLNVVPLNDAAIITGDTTGNVAEDGTLTASGTLMISDIDGAAEEVFVAQTDTAGIYGAFSVDASGTWSYVLDNGSATVQALNASDAVPDTFTVTSADGTTQDITVNINGADEQTGPLAYEISDILDGTAPWQGMSFYGNPSDRSGTHVAGGGDINGDGITDVVIGSFANDIFAQDSGATYVIYGGYGLQPGSFVSLTDLDVAVGYTIAGSAFRAQSGRYVSMLGDVNGDGIDDVIVGAYRSSVNGTDSGQTYVVFGSETTPASGRVNASELDGTNGYLINGAGANDFAGDYVSSSGDINGDGVDDIVIGGRDAGLLNGASVGESYVILGGVDRGADGPVELSSLDGADGFTILGGDASSRTISIIGDINSDGIDDFAIGAVGADPNGLTDAGQTYVVFGNSGLGNNGTLDITSLDGTNGFILNGGFVNNAVGSAVSGAGDVNGDGIQDLIVGAWGADTAAGTDAGQTYVIFGSASVVSGGTIDLGALDGTQGFSFGGINAGDFLGIDVSYAGDFNGDGIGDLIASAYRADPDGRADAGQTYVIYGDQSLGAGGVFDLSALNGTNGFALNGIAAGDLSGSAVAGAGDVNNDGSDDLIVSAFQSDRFGGAFGTDVGETYIIFGGALNNARPIAADDTATTNEDTSVTIDLLANDTDDDGDILSPNIVTDPSNGSVDVNVDGTVTYTPNALYSGLDSFTYVANDGGANSAQPATVTIDIGAVADAPNLEITTVVSQGEETLSFGSEFRVNAEIIGSQTTPQVIQLNDDRVFLTWSSADPDVDGDSNGIAGRIGSVLADGTVQWGSEFRVNSEVQSVQNLPQVTQLADERVFVTWQSADLDLDGDSFALAGRVGAVQSDGSLQWGDEFLIHAEVEGRQAEPQVTQLADGRVFLTWTSLDPDVDGDVSGIAGRVGSILADGNVQWGDEFRVNSEVQSFQQQPQVTQLADSRVFLTWESSDPDVDGDASGIAGRVGSILADGNVQWGDEFRVNSEVQSFQSRPQITQLADGRVFITWQSADSDVDGDSNGIAGRIGSVLADGTVQWGSEFRVNSEVQSFQEQPQVTQLADGRVFLAWRSNDPDVDGEASGIAGRIGAVQSDGTVLWGEEFPVNAEVQFNQFFPQLTQLNDGRIFLTWTSDDPDVDGNSQGIAARILTLVPATNTIDLSLTADLVDTDGSETIAAIELTGLPDGFIVSDGTNTATSDGTTPVSIIGFALDAISITPSQGFEGDVTITATATSTESSNGDTASASQSVAVTIEAPNTAPVAFADPNYSIDEDNTLNISALAGILANDSDADDNVLTASLVDDVSNGTLTLNEDGSFDYTPNNNFNGIDTFTYVANDGAADSTPAAVTITVNPVNDAPIALSEVGNTTEDVANRTFDVLANDTDPDGDTLTIASASALVGSVVINPDNTLSYTTAPNFNGVDTVTYTVSDGNGGFATVDAPMNVAAVNDAPTVTVPGFDSSNWPQFTSKFGNVARNIFPDIEIFDADLDATSYDGALLSLQLEFAGPLGTVNYRGGTFGVGDLIVVGGEVVAEITAASPTVFALEFNENADTSDVSFVAQGLSYQQLAPGTTGQQQRFRLTFNDGGFTGNQGAGGEAFERAFAFVNHQTVTTSGFDGKLVSINGAPVLVSDEVEATGGSVLLDITDDTIFADITITGTGVGQTTTISEINNDITDILGVSVIDPAPGWTASSTSSSVTISFAGGSVSATDDFAVRVNFAPDDPIILDLGEQGISFLPIEEGIDFDITGNGVIDKVAWTTGEDGILVMDLDGSGAIENGTELISTVFGGNSYDTALDALSTLDHNQDGTIDANDSTYESLSIWIDSNSDGVTDAVELRSLTEADIASIYLAATTTSETLDDQQVLARGTFRTYDFEQRTYLAVDLEHAEGDNQEASSPTTVGFEDFPV